MIQRIQTVWWLLSIALLGNVVWVPLFEFGEGKPQPPFTALYHCHFFLGVIIAAILLTLATILLYKNRKLQIRSGYLICLLHVLMYVAIAVHYHLDKGYHILPGMALPAVSLIFQILAIRAVKKDDALVRSMDRLR